MKGIKIFEIEKKPRKGLLAIEWIILGYMVLTLLLALFMSTKIHNIDPMIWGRFRIAMMMLGLWVVYRLIPCRFTMFTRIALQLLLLGVWYPETFEFNRHFPNLDHLFAAHEQTLCGCQPALLFSQNITNPVFSELMHLGYASYFPLIAIVTLFYFFKRYDQFLRAEFIILGAFFIYYVIFIILPVTGPQYYYLAAGFDQIAKGVFPDMGNYFSTHMDARCRRAPHSRLPKQSCGYHHHPDVPRLAHTLQTPLLGHDSFLRPDVFRHRLYPGALRHRRDCWMDLSDCLLRRFAFFIEKICLIQN